MPRAECGLNAGHFGPNHGPKPGGFCYNMVTHVTLVTLQWCKGRYRSPKAWHFGGFDPCQPSKVVACACVDILLHPRNPANRWSPMRLVIRGAAWRWNWQRAMHSATGLKQKLQGKLSWLSFLMFVGAIPWYGYTQVWVIKTIASTRGAGTTGDMQIVNCAACSIM